MMKNRLDYKGYHAKIEYIPETQSIHGKISGIKDLVTFEADRLEDVEREFRQAVDDYLIFCEDIGEAPETEHRKTSRIRNPFSINLPSFSFFR
jgi:predicted HicB family RNase H-like nuclease